MKILNATVSHALVWAAVCAWAVVLTTTGATAPPFPLETAPATASPEAACRVPAPLPSEVSP